MKYTTLYQLKGILTFGPGRSELFDQDVIVAVGGILCGFTFIDDTRPLSGRISESG